MKPEIFETGERLEELKKTAHLIDQYQAQVAELHTIDAGANPGDGKWVYYPWSSTLVHILSDEYFQTVRTARNKLLITAEEQQKFYNAVIGIAGLSVGNSVALAIVLQGGARRIKIADHDTLDLSNLNRIRAGVTSLGISKVEMTARQIYELNPYAEVEEYPEGLTDENMDRFFNGLTLAIDEIDNLAIKYRIREEAKKRKLPVLMAADNDRAGVVDIERYDLDPNLTFFHGRLGSRTYGDLLKLDKPGTGKVIAELIGLENHTERMLTSLKEIGKTIVSWPQLGATALLNGALLAHAAFCVINNLPLTTDRAIVDVQKILTPPAL